MGAGGPPRSGHRRGWSMAKSWFWQGGRRIEVDEDAAAVTIHAPTETDAHDAAARSGVELRAAAPAAPGLMRAEVVGDRDVGMQRLRDASNVVHHVYRGAASPD